MLFTLKAGDRLKPLKARLIDGDDTTPDLTGDTITFSMRDADTGEVVISDQPVTILSASPPADEDEPNVQYEWGPNETDSPGRYLGEFKRTTGGIEGRYPDDSNIEILIRRVIA